MEYNVWTALIGAFGGSLATAGIALIKKIFTQDKLEQLWKRQDATERREDECQKQLYKARMVLAIIEGTISSNPEWATVFKAARDRANLEIQSQEATDMITFIQDLIRNKVEKPPPRDHSSD